MSRRSIILATIGLLLAGLVLYNLFLAPPPSLTQVQSLLTLQESPGVVNMSTGAVLPGIDNGIQVTGVYPLSWGAVAVYHSNQMEGDALLTRGVFGWGLNSWSWGPITAQQQQGAVRYEHTYAFDGQNIADLVLGQVLSAGVLITSVHYDDGTVIEQPIVDQRFTFVTTGHGVACELEALDQQRQVVERITFRPYVPPGQDPTDYDCQP